MPYISQQKSVSKTICVVSLTMSQILSLATGSRIK